MFGWLGWFSDAKRKCLICGHAEPNNKEKREKLFHECLGCLYLYCNECWADIDKICYVCNPPASNVVDVQEFEDIEVAEE